MTTDQETNGPTAYEGEDYDLSGYSEVPPGSDGPPMSPDEVNAELQRMIAPTRPDVPTIDDPPQGSCELLLGLERDGTHYRTALVREMNGADEEAISRLPRNASNYNVLVVDLHLRRAVLQIGPVDVTKNPDVLGELLISDRDILFKEILLTTYGKTRTYERIVCPTCSFEMDMTIDIEGLIEVTRPREFEGEKFVVELRDGRKVLMHHATGKDQLAVFDSNRTLSNAEANTGFIARCVKKVDGESLADPDEWARNLGSADRRKIVDALLDIPALGFKEVEVPCQRCEENLPTAFGWADLLPG